MDEEDDRSIYRVKNIKFQGSLRRILLQNQNGPCPLLGLANVLLLRNQLQLPYHAAYVSLPDLLNAITNVLVDLDCARAKALDDAERDAWRDNFDGCLKTLYTLHAGMDVNVHFNNVEAVEFTENVAIFDLVDIRILHGWVVSEQDVVMRDLIANDSYNTVVERVMSLQENSSASDRQKAALITNWMEETCSQMTHDGLHQLYAVMRERELAILFRNSHFATIFKKNGRLYLLNTDIGFLDSDLIWEMLDTVDGDTTLVGHDFQCIAYAGDVQQPPDIESAPYDEYISTPLHPGSGRQMILAPGSRVEKYCLPVAGVIIIVVLMLLIWSYFSRRL